MESMHESFFTVFRWKGMAGCWSWMDQTYWIINVMGWKQDQSCKF